ncbi:MAG: hypothetical protein ABI717_02080, partial [Actinomycetota bacterium]
MVAVGLFSLIASYFLPFALDLKLGPNERPVALPAVDVPLFNFPILQQPKGVAAKPREARQQSPSSRAQSQPSRTATRNVPHGVAQPQRVPVVTSTYVIVPQPKSATKKKDPFENAPVVDESIGAVPPPADPSATQNSAAFAPTPAAAPAPAAQTETTTPVAEEAAPASEPTASDDTQVPVYSSVAAPEPTRATPAGTTRPAPSASTQPVRKVMTRMMYVTVASPPSVEAPLDLSASFASVDAPAVAAGESPVLAEAAIEVPAAPTVTTVDVVESGPQITSASEESPAATEATITSAASGGGSSPSATTASTETSIDDTPAAAAAPDDAVLPALDPAAVPGSGPSPPDPWAMTLSLDETHTISLTGDGDELVLTVDGVSTSRSAASVTAISVTGGGQADTFAVGSGITVPITLDGGDGEDTLAGPGGDQTWTITGAGAGTVGSVSFSGMENLNGAAGNEDTFVLEPGASVGGTLAGGDGGFDSLVLEGDYASPRFTATGPQSGWIDLGGGTLVYYDGLEPITSTGTAADAIVEASAGADRIVVELDPVTPGSIRVRSQSATFESVSIAMPTTSLTIRGLGGADSITVTALTGYTGSLILEGGNENDRIDVSAYGGAATLRGGDGDDVLTGGPGAQNFDGGSGVNTVDESRVVAFRTATLTVTDTSLTMTPATGPAQVDAMTSIQRVVLTGANPVATLAAAFAGFSGQIVFTSGLFDWTEQGPGPAGGSSSGADVAGNAVVGAINAVVVHPTNAGIMYVGAVNGGVWKTTDGGGTWVPLTDPFPSLAINALALDLDDPNTVYAGTGSSSSYNNEGGAAAGVLKSTDGGANWTILGGIPRGERVAGIVAKGTLVVVATGSPDPQTGGGFILGGLYRSTNGGASFTKLTASFPAGDEDGDGLTGERTVLLVSVGAAGTGYQVADEVTANLVVSGVTAHVQARFKVLAVDGGAVRALAVLDVGAYSGTTTHDPVAVATTGGSGTGLRLELVLSGNEYGLPAGNPAFGTAVSELKIQPPANATDPLTIYAAIPRVGIFRSDDDGLHWTNVTSNIPFALVGGVSADSPGNYVETLRIRLATTGSGTVYAALIRSSALLYEDVAAGATTIKLRREDPFFAPFDAGDQLVIGLDPTDEKAKIASVSQSNAAYTLVTLTAPLTNAHKAGSMATATVAKTTTVTLTGTPNVGERWVVTLAGTDYGHTVTAGQTLANVVAAVGNAVLAAPGYSVGRNGSTIVATRLDGTAFTTTFAVQPSGSTPVTGSGAVDASTARTTTATVSGDVVPGDIWAVVLNGTEYRYVPKPGDRLAKVALELASQIINVAGFAASADAGTLAVVRLDGAAFTLTTRVVTNGVRVHGFGSTRLAALYRSDNRGESWSAIPLPVDTSRGITSENGGINHGGQAEKHFSIAADPSTTSVLYLGGDTIPTSPFTGNLFRWNGTSWEFIAQSGANNTAPHADSRNMTFSGADLLQVDDGGIYKLTLPGTVFREWVSINGNLRVFEFVSVAYDAVNDVITGGAQDNGALRQGVPDVYVWEVKLGGDGVTTDGGSTSTTGYAYTSTQNLGNFSKIVDTAAGPAQLTILPLQINGTGIINDEAIRHAVGSATAEWVDKTIFSRFEWPVAVNAVDPQRFLIGTEVIYEEDPDRFFPDRGEDVSLRNGKPNLNVFSTSQIPETARIGRVEAIAYGGFERNSSGALIGKAEVAYVVATNVAPGSGMIQGSGTKQSDGSLWVRVGAAGDGYNFVRVPSFTAAVSAVAGGKWAPVDVAMHPEDWRQVFVLDNGGRIWHSTLTSPSLSPSAALTFAPWKEVTRNSNLVMLTLTSQQTVQSLAVVVTDTKANNNAADDAVAIVAGALGGVFATRLDLTIFAAASPPAQSFFEVGDGLPNIQVMDVRYDATDDVLVAGTLGRGAWTLHNARLALGQGGTVAVYGSTSTTLGDDIVLRRNATSPWRVDVLLSTPAGALSTTATASFQLSSIAVLHIDGRAGNDDVLVDGTNGPVAIAGGIIFADSAGAADILRIENHLNDRDHSPGSGYSTDGRYRFVDDDRFAVRGYSAVNVQVSGVESIPYVRMSTSPVPAGVTNFLLHTPESEFQGGLEELLRIARGLFTSATGTTLGAIDIESFGTALNGTLFTEINPSRIRGSFSQVAAGGALQVDMGGSFLERVLADGIDFADLASLLGLGPEALRDALLAAGATVNATELDGTTPIGGSSSYATGAMFDVQLTKTLEGIVDLEAAGDAIVAQLGLGDALGDTIDIRGSLEIGVDLGLRLVFGIDGDGFFIAPTTDGEFTVANLRLDGSVVAYGKFGFLGVSLTNVTLDVAPGVTLRFDLVDVAPADGKLRIPELLGEILDIVEFTLTSPGTNDVVLSGTLNAAAAIPGLDSFNLAATDFSFTWADIGSGTFAATVSSDSGQSGSSFLNFLKLKPQVLLDQLVAIKSNLSTLVANANVVLPFLSESLQDRVSVAQAFAQRILSQLDLSNGFGTPTPNFRNAQDLLAGLASSLTDVREDNDSPTGFEDVIRPLESLGLAYDPNTGELTYDIDARFAFSDSDTFDLDFGIGGASASTVDLQVVLTIAFTLGIDLDGLDFNVGSILDNLFVRNASVAVTIALSIDDLDLSAFGVSISGDSLEGNVAVSFSLVDPSASPDGRISVRELIDAVTSDPFGLIDNLLVSGSLTGTNVAVDLFGVVHVT